MLQIDGLGPLDLPPTVLGCAPTGAQLLGDQLPAKELVDARRPRPRILLDSLLSAEQLRGPTVCPGIWADVAASASGLAAASTEQPEGVILEVARGLVSLCVPAAARRRERLRGEQPHGMIGLRS